MRTHLADFFGDRGDVAVLKIHVIKSPTEPDGLTLLAIRSNDPRKSRERAHLANAGDFIHRSAKIAIAAPGTPGDFRRSAYKIAKCVAGLT